MLKNNIYQSILTLIILSSFCFGQISGGGTLTGGSGVLGGGKAESLLKKDTGLNKKIFAGLGTKPTKSTTISKKTTAKKVTPKTKATPVGRPKNTVVKPPVYEETTDTALTFQPVGNNGFDEELANMLTQKPDEKVLLLTIFRESKKGFNQEAKKLGRENDIALATTFFLTACITVYHQSPDPTDEAVEALYDSMATAMSSSPETAQMSNQEKQLTSDKLVYLGGFILTGYLLSKQSGDKQAMQIFRQAAASCFQAFTNLKVQDYQFTATGLKINS
jgi:hypothetical protein